MKRTAKKLELKKFKIVKLNRLHDIKGQGEKTPKSPNPLECPPTEGEISIGC